MTEQAAEKLAWMRDAMRGNNTMVWSINDFAAVTGSYQNSTGHTLGFVRAVALGRSLIFRGRIGDKGTCELLLCCFM